MLLNTYQINGKTNESWSLCEMTDNNKERSDSFDHLIYMRVFEGCNLHCDHCFIPANPKKMKIDVVKELKDHVEKFANDGDTLLIQWHGGEPTAIGYRFMEEALEIINRDLGERYIIKHSIQTNLINYNERWAGIYKKYFNSEVGISWDADIRLMKKDKPETHAVYEEIFWNNVRKLVSDGIRPSLVVTGTKKFFQKYKNPIHFYQKLIDYGVPEVHIEKLTKTGNARENWDSLGLSYKEHSEHMKRFLKVYSVLRMNNEQKLFVSPFDGLIESVFSMGTQKPKGYGCNSGKCDTAFHTVDANGYKAGCTALTTNEQVSNSKYAKDSKTIAFSGILKRRETKVVNCFECKFRSICNSGCATEPTSDNSGECSGGFIIYNEVQRLLERRIVTIDS